MAILYHGTCIEGLNCIKANAKSHTTGRIVAYFTEDRVYALACCRSPKEDFVTMGIIENVYEAILEEERKGNVVIHKYQDIDPVEQKMHANHIKEHLDDNKIMKPFYLKNFSTLWD